MTTKKIKDFLLKSENNLIFLAVSSAIFVLRSNIPYAIYIFAIIQTIVLINTFKNNRFKHIPDILKSSINSFYAYYLIIFFFIVGFVIGPRNLNVYKEIINIVVLLSFILLFITTIITLADFHKFKNIFLNSFILLFFSYLAISFTISIFNNTTNQFLFAVNAFGSFDRNIYSLNLWISVIAVIRYTRIESRQGKIVLGNLIIFILLVLILLSSSRRGIIFLSIFSITFIGYQIYGFTKPRNFYKNFKILAVIYMTGFLVFVALIFLPSNYKYQLFDKSHINNEIKNNISRTSLRYYKLIKPHINFEQYNEILWGSKEQSSEIKTDPIKKGQDLLSVSRIAYKEKDYTSSINLVREAIGKTDSIEYFFDHIPKDLSDLLPVKDKIVINYLPELAKLPYFYSNFFSCMNLENLFLEDYNKSPEEFPYTFSLKKDRAKINLTLPALSNSEYELNFMIKSKNNPVEKLNSLKSNDANIRINEHSYQNQGTFFYNNRVSVFSNKNVSLDLAILLKNNVNDFTISDISWNLINTSNNETSEYIYEKAKIELNKFKFEQNRAASLWKYYYNAEQLTNLVDQKYYRNKSILPLINNITSNLSISEFVGTQIVQNKDKMHIIFKTGNSFSRAKVFLPLIQNAVYQLDLTYQHSSNSDKLYHYFKNHPDIGNVHLKTSTLRDTILEIRPNVYKKIIKFRVDSINSAIATYAFGYWYTLHQEDTLAIENFSFELLKIEKDSLLLSKAQYDYLKDWEKRIKPLKEDKAHIKERIKYENEEYWQIDSAVYESVAYDRIELLVFGWQYFQSLPLYKKILGEGFEHLKIYSLRFRPKGSISFRMTPHNPALSALLYSGIIGLIAYILFLTQLFYYYVKQRKDLGVFLIIFLLIFSYIFFSTNGMFTDPLFIVFSLFPFLLNYIKTNSAKSQEK